ncbi:hypothetical protein MTR_6g033550 [Medicago truncatula]|uniref:Uncharacterized protein n=1 Tax=Medicago truncatula TaxID=3880 RepID=A0A072UIQ9_MEDTR|nr:hypothetical protein MTR_6g033550 [Medicago truncatula]
MGGRTKNATKMIIEGPFCSVLKGHDQFRFVRSSKLLLLFSVAVPEELTGGTKESDGLLVGS